MSKQATNITQGLVTAYPLQPQPGNPPKRVVYLYADSNTGKLNAIDSTGGNAFPSAANNVINAKTFNPPTLKFNPYFSIAGGTKDVTIIPSNGSSLQGLDTFTAADVGAAVLLSGCGTNLGDFWTTIASVSDESNCTLTDVCPNAPFSGAAENVYIMVWGPNAGTNLAPAFHDASPAIGQAISAASAIGGECYVPGGAYCYATPLFLGTLDPNQTMAAFYGENGMLSTAVSPDFLARPTLFVAQNPAVAANQGLFTHNQLFGYDSGADFSKFSVLGACYPSTSPGRTSGSEIALWTYGAFNEISVLNSSFTYPLHLRASGNVISGCASGPYGNGGASWFEMDETVVNACAATAFVFDCTPSGAFFNLGGGGTALACVTGSVTHNQGYANAYQFTPNAASNGRITFSNCFVFGSSGGVDLVTGFNVKWCTLTSCATDTGYTTDFNLNSTSTAVGCFGKVNGSITYINTFTKQLSVPSLLLNGSQILNGTGSPNGAVTGNPGDLYLNTSGGAGTTLYVKESGTNSNTGWVGK